MSKITRNGEKLIIGLTPEEQAKQEKDNVEQEARARPQLALKEMQEYLIAMGFKPKYKL